MKQASEPAMEPLRIEVINDGHVIELINQELGVIGRHVIDYPGIEKPRKVTFECSIKPLLAMGKDPMKTVNHPIIEIRVKRTLPPLPSPGMIGRVEHGRIVIDPMNRDGDDPGQTYIPMGDYGDTSVTVSTPGSEPVKTTAGELSRLAKDLEEKGHSLAKDKPQAGHKPSSKRRSSRASAG